VKLLGKSGRLMGVVDNHPLVAGAAERLAGSATGTDSHPALHGVRRRTRAAEH
jgi:hypothetical protein